MLQLVSKVRSSNFMHYDVWSKLLFVHEISRCLFLYRVHVFWISVTGMPFLFCLFVVVFFITFCSRCGMEWDTACRPTDDPFRAFFINWCAGASSTPKQYSFSLGSWKNIYIGHSSPSTARLLLLLYKFETSWALLGRLSRGFFAISRASNFKHSLFMTLSVLLTMWELPRRVSYFVSSPL